MCPPGMSSSSSSGVVPSLISDHRTQLVQQLVEASADLFLDALDQVLGLLLDSVDPALILGRGSFIGHGCFSLCVTGDYGVVRLERPYRQGHLHPSGGSCARRAGPAWWT